MLPARASVSSPEERDAAVTDYLDSFVSLVRSSETKWPRLDCCGTSRSLYCPECCRLLVPETSQPELVREGRLRLPFDLHLVLHDRRNSSTGLHAMVLLRDDKREMVDDICIKTSALELKNSLSDMKEDGLGGNCSSSTRKDYGAQKQQHPITRKEPIPFNDCLDINNKARKMEVKLIDLGNDESIPDYENESSCSNANDGLGTLENGKEEEGLTCLLFPSPGESIPLSEVAPRLSRLVVLDCKWTKTKSTFHPNLRKLQKVHLTNAPNTSHFWRWHSAGSGMISTIEAIYCASLEVAQHRKQGWDRSKQLELLHLLWLFGIQRAAAGEAALKSGRSTPFSNAGKEQQRALRKCIGTEKHERDKEKGRILKEEAKKKKNEALSLCTDAISAEEKPVR